jgi:hypothetical protein
MKTKLLIVYESADGTKALPVAKVDNRALLLNAARQAVDEKRSEAEGLSHLDGDLGMMAVEEANRLERTLAALIPELGVEIGRGSVRSPVLTM